MKVLKLSLFFSVWIFFPVLNGVLSLAGVIDSTSPPGPEALNELVANRQTIVAGCEDVQHHLPDYPRPYPEYFPGYLDEDYFPEVETISRLADYAFPPVAATIRYAVRESLRLAARRSRAVGSDLAADNLEHFLNNSGETVTDFNVEGLMRDLPVLRELIRQTLNTSAAALIEQNLSQSASTPCRQFSYATQPWIITGLGGNPSIMPNIHIDSRPFSPTFHLLYAEPDYPYRDELDVWMGMDPIWYAVGESVIVNMESQQAEICYQVFIYFPYRWYDVAFVDRIMGLTDGAGISEHYDLEGTSGTRCDAFRVGEEIISDGSRMNPG